MAIKKPLRVSVFCFPFPFHSQPALSPSLSHRPLRRIEIASRNAIEIGTGHGQNSKGTQGGECAGYVPGQVKAQSKRFARGGCAGNMQN